MRRLHAALPSNLRRLLHETRAENNFKWREQARKKRQRIQKRIKRLRFRQMVLEAGASDKLVPVIMRMFDKHLSTDEECRNINSVFQGQHDGRDVMLRMNANIELRGEADVESALDRVFSSIV